MRGSELKVRAERMGDQLRERRLESKLDDIDRENLELKTELRSLRDTVERERETSDDLRGALQKGRTVKVKRKRHILRTVALAGGAYLLGSRSGREHYEWFTAKVKDLKERVGSQAETIEDLAEDPMSSTTPAQTPSTKDGVGSGLTAS
jgi:chromosome segregation ATPase